MFELFDKRQAYAVRKGGKLPHWYQPGVTYFITFRTDDSVPQPLLRSWHNRRDRWLREHGFDPTQSWKDELRRQPDFEREYHATFTKPFMAYLDQGYGSCPLRERRAAQLLADALHHFDGERYHLGDYVIMPNHAHVIACLLDSNEVEAQCKSWKQYSATKINQLLDQKGRFWQPESFDHLVRSPEQFEYLQRYIAENPRKARLKEGEFLHWNRPM